MIGISSIDRRQDVVLDLVRVQEPSSTHDFMERWCAPFIYAVRIVHGLWAIQTQPDQEMVLAEKLAPGIVQEDAIGLHGMLDADAWASVDMHKIHGAFEEVETHQGGFATLPGNRDLGRTLRFEQLADIGLEGLIAHAKAAVGVEFLLGEEKAIGAIQVASGARRFAQDVKRRGGVPGPTLWKARHGLRYWMYRC